MKLNNKTIVEVGNLWAVGIGDCFGKFKIDFLKSMIDKNYNSYRSVKDPSIIIGIFKTYREACRFKSEFKKVIDDKNK